MLIALDPAHSEPAQIPTAETRTPRKPTGTPRTPRVATPALEATGTRQTPRLATQPTTTVQRPMAIHGLEHRQPLGTQLTIMVPTVAAIRIPAPRTTQTETSCAKQIPRYNRPVTSSKGVSGGSSPKWSGEEPLNLQHSESGFFTSGAPRLRRAGRGSCKARRCSIGLLTSFGLPPI